MLIRRVGTAAWRCEDRVVYAYLGKSPQCVTRKEGGKRGRRTVERVQY